MRVTAIQITMSELSSLAIAGDDRILSPIAMQNEPSCEYPRIRDLPENERQSFREHLFHQTRPILTDEAGRMLPREEQDAYNECDNIRWKKGLPVTD